MRTRPRRRGRRPELRLDRSTPQSGTTLIEVLVAAVIMGIAFAVIVGGLGSSIVGSDIHRRQNTASAFVRNAAETLKDNVATEYQHGCPANYPEPSDADFDVDIAVLYWDGDGAYTPTCVDSGLQLIKITATTIGPGRASTATLEVVKRQP